ncbi:MAG TPA: LysR family transcriptional regulator [Steroidobacteraceae bacterium]|jgi:DNA-binding transcriptional LysR family regulator|nr:LysR family transcriptional regulator [Steroidobacteraceae bacterium]
MELRVSLDQWQALKTVVEAGGYAQAAARLHKSQSAITYAVQKIETQLKVKLFELEGRKARLTSEGEVLFQRARALLEEAESLESAGRRLAQGWESELKLAVEAIFPTWLLLQCFAAFAQERPQIRIELYETVLSGTEEALLQRRVDLGICSSVPNGFFGSALMPIPFVAAANPEHPLHRLKRKLTMQDLRKHRHLVVRDSGSARTSDVPWLQAEQRWTVSHKATQIHAACLGLGFAWFAQDTIRNELQDGKLKPLALRDGSDRVAQLYLVQPDQDAAGPGARRLSQIIREQVIAACRDS